MGVVYKAEDTRLDRFYAVGWGSLTWHLNLFSARRLVGAVLRYSEQSLLQVAVTVQAGFKKESHGQASLVACNCFRIADPLGMGTGSTKALPGRTRRLPAVARM